MIKIPISCVKGFENISVLILQFLFSLSTSGLVYLGDAIYGVQMKKTNLERCIKHSSTPEKLASNLLEFLVTKEDCQDMTVYYGHGKAKKEMSPNLRKAIKGKN